MAQLPFVSQVVRALIKYSAPGIQDLVTRMFWNWAGTLSQTALQNWANNVGSVWLTEIAPLVPAGLILTECTAEDLTSATGPAATEAFTHPGSRSGGGYAPAVAFIIQDTIARRYRGGHPRKYLPGLDITQTATTDANTWLATYANTVVTAWNAFIAGISGANAPSGTTTWSECNVSYYSGFTAVQNPLTGRYRNVPKLRTTPLVDIISAHTYNTHFGSQRRRNAQSV
jgi:hypothetical protein